MVIKRLISALPGFYFSLVSYRFEDEPFVPLSMALNVSKGEVMTDEQSEIALKEVEDKLLSQVRPSHRKKIESLLPMARLFLDYREHTKYHMIRIFLPIHRALLLIGERLVAEGWIDRKDDVMFLQIDDLLLYEQSANAAGGFRVKIEEAKELFHSAKTMTVPRVIEGPECAMMTISRKTIRSLENLPPNIIRGVPASAGVVEGIAVVATDPHSTVIQRGEILIAHATDPGWTPLFTVASGVAIEIGGPLTHGSVVAKELGIPCVSGATDLLSKVKSGMKVRVDGTKGIVEVLDMCHICFTNIR